ncbi:metallophosphoesterase [Deinococcus maricopensis]|uniref:Metallophosphoesterase n=1 Tax=Deinococcus maricopensis (strain DSM 21211 / LMG 22137 / NRRL B-23946 / LB-34) TaxID=709986 RepID=E8U9B5_DEIML|nr:metallophosphoesterase [Deinococcus maricopensis]ADV67654.1 metallophosphoesterase [Deinococcus maricopensis DSM 21211]
MRVFAIADLHLAFVTPKPMTVFGPTWAGHPDAIFDRWRDVVRPDDVVLLPGDLSWAMKLPDALTDLAPIAALPGTKVLLRGNHDYWWPSISKLRAALPSGMYAVQNDALRFGDVVVCGTRGWSTPGSDEFGAEDARIYAREQERLKLSLDAAGRLGGARTVLMLHYPPTSANFSATGFTALIEAYRPDAVVYGHLHGANPERTLRRWQGTPAHLVAADALQFTPKLILDDALNVMI